MSKSKPVGPPPLLLTPVDPTAVGRTEAAQPASGAKPLAQKDQYDLGPAQAPEEQREQTARWVECAAEAILPFSAIDWRSAPLSAATPVPSLDALRASASGADPKAPDLARTLGVPRQRLVEKIGREILQASSLDASAMMGALTRALGKKVGRRSLTLSQDSVARFISKNAEAIHHASVTACASRWEDDARFLAERMEQHPKLSTEELRRMFGQGRRHMTAAYARALPYRLDARGAVTQQSFDFWPQRDVDRLGPEPHFLLAAQLAYQLLDAPPGATYASVLESWRHVWEPYWNLTEHLTSDRTHSEMFDPGLIELLRRAYPFIPEWPGGIRPNDALTLDQLRSFATTPMRGGPDPFRASMLTTRLEELRKVKLVSEEYEWYAQSALAPELGALEGTVQVETEHAITDKFPAKRQEILLDGARGEDIWNIVKSYSTDAAVADCMERSLGIHVVRAGRDDIAELTEKCIEDRISEGRGPILLHIQGVRVWSLINAQAKENLDLPIFGVSHTTSDRREYAKAGVSLGWTLVEDMAGSEAKKVHEREMFERSFVHHVTGMIHDLDLDVRGYRFVVLGFGEIIGRSMWQALAALPHTRGDGLVVYDPHLAPEVRRAAQERGVVFIDNLEGELGTDRPHFVVECVGEKNIVQAKHFKALKRPCILTSFGTGSNAFALKSLEKLSSDEDGRPLRVSEGRVGILPTFTYEIPTEEGTTTVTMVGAGSVFNFTRGASNISSESVFNNIMVLDSKRQAVVDWHLDRRGVRRHEAVLFERGEDGQLTRSYPPRWDLLLESRDPELYFGRNKLLDTLLLRHHPALDPCKVIDEADPFDQLQQTLAGGGYRQDVHQRLLERAKSAGANPSRPRPTAASTSGARSWVVSSWPELLDLIELQAERGELKALSVDLDNVLFRPRGYVASEQQEWDCVAAGVPRERVLERRGRDEARLLSRGLFERPGRLNSGALERLVRLAHEHHLALIANTARPERIRDETLDILKTAGVDPGLFERVLFTGSRSKKTEALEATLAELGVEAHRTLVVDDLEENLSPAGARGMRTARLEIRDVNYAGFTSYGFLRLARLAEREDERLEFLLNAAARSRSAGEVENVLGVAARVLTADRQAELEAEVRDLLTILPPRH